MSRIDRLKDARGIVLLKPYADYCAEYQKLVCELIDRLPRWRNSRNRYGDHEDSAASRAFFERYFGLA